MAEKEARVRVTEVRNAVLWSDGTLTLKKLRASYPHVLKKYKGEDSDGEGKFSIVGLMPKRKRWRAARELVLERIEAVKKENKAPAKMKADNMFFRDGDAAGREECEGMWTINASEANKVSVRDSKNDKKTGKPRILVPGKDDDVIFPGCWVNMVIRPWYQNNKYGKKVNSGLVAVQHCPLTAVHEDWKGAVDDPFGTGRISEEDIDESMDSYDDDDDSDDDDDEEDGV